MDMNRRDDAIRRLQESALCRLSQQELSTLAGGFRSQTRDSRVDFFAVMAEQFVEQVKAITRIDDPSEEEEEEDDDGMIPLELDTRIKKEPDQASETFELSRIPSKAASRLVEVLKNEFGVLRLELGKSSPNGDSMGSIVRETKNQRDARDLSLHRSAEGEMREVKQEPIIQTNASETLQANTAAADDAPSTRQYDDQFDRFANKLSDVMGNIVDVLANKISKTLENCSRCKSSSSSSADLQEQVSTSSKSSDQEATSPSTSAASQATDRGPSEGESACSSQLDSNASDLSPPNDASLASDLSASEPTSQTKRKYKLRRLIDASTDSDADETTSLVQLQRHAIQKSRENQRIFKSRKLVKRAITSGLAKPSSRSAGSSRFLKEYSLPKQVVENIFLASSSIPNFAKNLLHRLFNQTELIGCTNLFGRESSGREIGGSLDDKRVDLIRRLVQERGGSSRKLWRKCVRAMNNSIRRVKLVGIIRPRFRLTSQSANELFQRKLYPKQNVKLKRSPVYEENGLSYQEIAKLYVRAQSVPKFAINLMYHLFTESELRECYNVYGRANGHRRITRRGLEEKRVSLIRRIVEENCDYGVRHTGRFWSNCVDRMNSHLKRRRQITQSDSLKPDYVPE